MKLTVTISTVFKFHLELRKSYRVCVFRGLLDYCSYLLFCSELSSEELLFKRRGVKDYKIGEEINCFIDSVSRWFYKKFRMLFCKKHTFQNYAPSGREKYFRIQFCLTLIFN